MGASSRAVGHEESHHETVRPGSIVVVVRGSTQGELAVTWGAERADRVGRVLTLDHAAASDHVGWFDIAGSSVEVDDL